MKRPPRQGRPRPPAAAARALAQPACEAEVTFSGVGARGEAVAETAQGPLYAPFALAGETAQVRIVGDRAQILAVTAQSIERVAPPCPHFGVCGGCQLQHWAEAPQLAWKRGLVVQALAKRGLEGDVAPIVPAWGAGRRRVGLHVQRQGGAVRFGFIERGGAQAAAISTCPLMTPGLQAALPVLEKLARSLAPARGDAVLQTLQTQTGLDVDVRGAGRVSARDRQGLQALAAAAEIADLARLSLEGESVLERRPPELRMGAAIVRPPPGSFVQATVAGEETMADLVLQALSGARRVADLFCGIGTFALRLAQGAEVWAVDGEPAMLAALKAAADRAGGALKGVETARRDLLRSPVSALELKRFDAIVFDPPRGGARLQAEQIAAAKAERVAAVACDAGAFARDARALVDAGFTMQTITPIDQFRWSPHVEIVGVFTR
jgi:23S rRNA (uracil1939-C5)-methyltransferase